MLKYTNVDIHKYRYIQMSIYTNVDTQIDLHKSRYTEKKKYPNRYTQM